MTKSIQDTSMKESGIITDKEYWDNRYNKRHGISGDGSRGRLLAYKAHTYNLLADCYNWKSVVDLGCGDGFIVPLIDHEVYLGYDISEKCIDYCNNHHYPDKNRRFVSGSIYNAYDQERGKYDVAISFDVTFHITDEDDYWQHLHVLSTVSNHVLIFTVNETQERMTELWGQDIPPHVYYRPAVKDISQMGMRAIQAMECPFDARDEIKEGNTFSRMYLLEHA